MVNLFFFFFLYVHNVIANLFFYPSSPPPYFSFTVNVLVHRNDITVHPYIILKYSTITRTPKYALANNNNRTHTFFQVDAPIAAVCASSGNTSNKSEVLGS